jgi:tetratricopeptide (TPR) repeat protein
VVSARKHALDYTDDLAFWSATREAAPESAKAHLNYSVMVGARGRLDERLAANRRAMEIAPEWPMAHVYYGDTLCRLKRTNDAWPHYKRGLELAPNDPNLIALSLQCLWDQNAIESRKDELIELSQRHPGSWLAFLASDIVWYGKQHGGVQKKYRPRSYDEGPKKG